MSELRSDRPQTPRRSSRGDLIRTDRSPSPAAIAIVVFAVLAALRLLVFRSTGSDSAASLERAAVRHVIDGDTIVLSDDRHVRLLGIDAPELSHDGKVAEPFATESTEWLRARIEGHEVRLQSSNRELDRYGRTLAWIYDADVLINEELLHAGMARLLPDYGLPIELEPRLRAAEAAAHVAKRGVWSPVTKRSRGGSKSGRN